MASRKTKSAKSIKRPGKEPAARVIVPTSVEAKPKRVVRPPGKKATSPEDALADFTANIPRGASPQAKRAWTKGLRDLLEQCVVTDRHRRPLLYWSEKVADLVAAQTFRLWAAEGKWLDKREEFLRIAREEMLREVGQEHVRQWISDLRSLDGLVDTLGAQIAGESNTTRVTVVKEDGTPVEVSVAIVPATFLSRGDAIRSFVALDKQRDEKRKNVLTALPIATATATAVEVPVTEATVSLPVALAMARAKLLAERAESEAETPVAARGEE